MLGPNSVRDALCEMVSVKQEREMINLKLDDATENERKHTWLSSMPVLHLGLILSMIIMGFPQGTSDEKIVFDLIDNPMWLHDALLKAEGIRMLIHDRVPEFNPDTALRLLPSEFLLQ